jgi:hypothetical protein
MAGRHLLAAIGVGVTGGGCVQQSATIGQRQDETRRSNLVHPLPHERIDPLDDPLEITFRLRLLLRQLAAS